MNTKKQPVKKASSKGSTITTLAPTNGVKKKEPEPGTWEAIEKAVAFVKRVNLTWP